MRVSLTLKCANDSKRRDGKEKDARAKGVLNCSGSGAADALDDVVDDCVDDDDDDDVEFLLL